MSGSCLIARTAPGIGELQISIEVLGSEYFNLRIKCSQVKATDRNPSLHPGRNGDPPFGQRCLKSKFSVTFRI